MLGSGSGVGLGSRMRTLTTPNMVIIALGIANNELRNDVYDCSVIINFNFIRKIATITVKLNNCLDGTTATRKQAETNVNNGAPLLPLE